MELKIESMSDIFDQYEAECKARFEAEERLRAVAASGGLTVVAWSPTDDDSESYGN